MRREFRSLCPRRSSRKGLPRTASSPEQNSGCRSQRSRVRSLRAHRRGLSVVSNWERMAAGSGQRRSDNWDPESDWAGSMKMAPGDSGAISLGSGDRIRTCDLWGMSWPVPVSGGLARLKRTVRGASLVQSAPPPAMRSCQLRRVSFTNPFTTRPAYDCAPPPRKCDTWKSSTANSDQCSARAA